MRSARRTREYPRETSGDFNKLRRGVSARTLADISNSTSCGKGRAARKRALRALG